MTEIAKRRVSLRFYRIRRRMKRKLSKALASLMEHGFRVPFLPAVCALVILSLLLGFALPAKKTLQTPSVASVFGDELTNALRYYGQTSGRKELIPEVTLFLLPELRDGAQWSEALDRPLYGFYLTGRELTYLPELVTSLADDFSGRTPYLGGLSYTHNRFRIRFNRAMNVQLSVSSHSVVPEKDSLYYVIGDDSVFSIFHYLSSQSLRLLTVQPKDSLGQPMYDYSSGMLLGKDGAFTLHSIYRTYLTKRTQAKTQVFLPQIYELHTWNTAYLLSYLNPAGITILLCFLLLLTLAVLLRPCLRRIRIWIRVFRSRRRKRGALPLRLRIQNMKITPSFFSKSS